MGKGKKYKNHQWYSHNRFNRKSGNQKTFTGKFKPYSFTRRKGGKSPLERTHEKLLAGNFDIAFEIEWTALTPIALNPCTDYGEKGVCPDMGNETDFSGYNRRWLTINGRPAISPFTVKSAISNAYANLMGGCYRVNTRIEGHREFEQGQYPYPGAYKRYRVAMHSSKPGIITEIKKTDDGSRFVRIQPVEEFYLDEDLPPNLKGGEEVYLKIVKDRGYNKPQIVEIVNKPGRVVDVKQYKPRKDDVIKAKYHGPYRCGMKLNKSEKHKHRFYIEKGSEITGTIREENFLPEEKLKEYVYLGGHDQNNKEIPLWYQDLRDLKEGDFVYYEEFNGEVCHIGKNFLFKALFLHEDTIPPDNKTCCNLEELCPRCALFGMTGEGENKEAVGFKGRFKASTLIADVRIKREKTKKEEVPINEKESEHVHVLSIKDEDENELGSQILLPIQGPPKPNKRDVDGYYEKKTGYLKGAKVYRHTNQNIDDLKRVINELVKKTVGKKGYSHRLRNWAEVLYQGITFKGTVGAENCTADEAAALMMLLHTPFSNHGFKLGLGKSIGFGSVSSKIKKIWIRTPHDYKWRAFELKGQDIVNELNQHGLPNLADKLKAMKQAKDLEEKLNMLPEEDEKIQLEFPDPGNKYWNNFNDMK